MIVKELFAKLGLEVDAGVFAAADKALGSLKLGALALGGAMAAVGGAAYSLMSNVRDTAVEASKAAQRTGLTVEAWQELKAAGEATGLSAEALEHSLILMSRSAYGAAEGSEELTKAFQKLGIHTKDSAGHLKNGDALLTELADKFSAMPDGIEKTALAMRAFGRSGAEMIPFLNKGADGIAELRQHAHELGLVLDAETIAASKGWKQDMREMSERIKGLKLQIGAKLLPAFLKLKDGMNAAGKALGSFFSTFIHHAKSTAIVLGLVAAAFLVAQVAAMAYAGTLGTVIAEYVALGVAAIAAAARATIAWLAAAAPIVGLVALIAALILLWEDFLVFLDGGDSVIGDLGRKWSRFLDNFLKPDPKGWWLLEWIKAALRALTDIQGTWENVKAGFTRAADFWKAVGADHGITFGGGASPAAAVQASPTPPAAGKVQVHAPVSVTVNAQTNASPDDIANHVARVIEDHHDRKVREAEAGVQ